MESVSKLKPPPTPQFWGEIALDSPQGWGARGASA